MRHQDLLTEEKREDAVARRRSIASRAESASGSLLPTRVLRILTGPSGRHLRHETTEALCSFRELGGYVPAFSRGRRRYLGGATKGSLGNRRTSDALASLFTDAINCYLASQPDAFGYPIFCTAASEAGADPEVAFALHLAISRARELLPDRLAQARSSGQAAADLPVHLTVRLFAAGLHSIAV